MGTLWTPDQDQGDLSMYGLPITEIVTVPVPGDETPPQTDMIEEALEETPNTINTGDRTRPTRWEEYIGQEKIKKRLRIHASAAKRRNEAMEHVLLVGPSGCGKTSLAALIAQEANVDFLSLMCPIDGKGFKTLTEHEGVVFLDELHKMKPADQEKLYPVVEDGYFQHVNGHRKMTPKLTIVGATTERGQIQPPLWDRFHVKPAFQPYTLEELGNIAVVMAKKLEVEIDYETAIAYAYAAAGRPRRIREYVVMARDLGNSDPSEVFEILGITSAGLNDLHIQYMKVLSKNNYQAGLDRIAANLRMKKAEIFDLEQILVDQGFVEYGTRGRILTTAGMEHLGEDL